MFIVKITEVYGKNIQGIKGNDDERLEAFKTKLTRNKIPFVDNGKSITLTKYLTAFIGIDWILQTNFSEYKENAIDVDAATADRLLKHRYAVGGNSDWKAIKEV